MDIIQPYIYRILQKVNQVIYTLDTICMPNIMTLVQAVLLFTRFHRFTLRKSKKVHNSATRSSTEKKTTKTVPLFFMLVLYTCIQFQDSSSNGSWSYPNVTDRRTDRPKPLCSLNFEEVGDITNFTNSFDHFWLLTDQDFGNRYQGFTYSSVKLFTAQLL